MINGISLDQRSGTLEVKSITRGNSEGSPGRKRESERGKAEAFAYRKNAEEAG